MSYFEEVIEFAQKTPLLWRRAHDLTSEHREKLRVAWERLSHELGVDENFLKSKWLYLKSRFRREYIKVLAANPTNPDEVEVIWKYYNDLKFLIDTYFTKDSLVHYNTIYNQRTCLPAESPSEDDDSGTDTLPSTKIRKCEDKTINFIDLWDEDEPAPITVPLSSPSSWETSSLIKMPEDNAKEKHRKPEKLGKSHHCWHNDSDYLFLMSLLPFLKNLTEIQKLQFKSKVNDWLLEICTQNEYSHLIYVHAAYQ